MCNCRVIKGVPWHSVSNWICTVKIRNIIYIQSGERWDWTELADSASRSRTNTSKSHTFFLAGSASEPQIYWWTLHVNPGATGRLWGYPNRQHSPIPTFHRLYTIFAKKIYCVFFFVPCSYRWLTIPNGHHEWVIEGRQQMGRITQILWCVG